MAEPDGIKVVDVSICSLTSVELEDGINDPPSPAGTTLDPNASPNQEVSDNELVSGTPSTEKSDDAAPPTDDNGSDPINSEGGNDAKLVVDDATVSADSTGPEVERTTEPTNLKVDLITNDDASDDLASGQSTTDELATSQTASDNLITDQTVSADVTTYQATTADLSENQPTAVALTANKTPSDEPTTGKTSSDVLIENETATNDEPAAEPNVAEKSEETTVSGSDVAEEGTQSDSGMALVEPSLPDIKATEDQGEQDVDDKQGSEDEGGVSDKQCAENERDVEDKSGAEDEGSVNDKQGIEEDETPLPSVESKLKDKPETVVSACDPESQKETEPTNIDQKDATCDNIASKSACPVEGSISTAASDSPADRMELQEECDISPSDVPMADTAAVPATDACGAEAASPSAQLKVLSYANFKPIVPENTNISDEEKESRSLVTAQDLPQLEDVSVDTSNDESAGRLSPDSVQLEGEVVADVAVPADAKNLGAIESVRPRAPNPAKPSLSSSDSVDEYSTSSDSFKQRREPDGDCDFLDQTLNISAIDTSMQYSESSATTDLPSLVMSTMGEQSHAAEIVEDNMNDAPGEVVKDESKITSDHSLLLLKNEANVHKCQVKPKTDLNVSAASLTSYISAEQSWEGIELIRAPSCHFNPAGRTQSAAEVKGGDQKKPSPANCQQRLRGCSPPILPGATSEQPNMKDPLLSRLSKAPSSSSHTPTGDPAKTSSAALAKPTTLYDDMNDANTPMARMRSSHAEGLVGRPISDPDGVVVDTLDSSVGGLKKPSNPRPEDRPRPRVSFASIHKGPHDDSHERFPSPRIIKQVEGEGRRSSASAEEVRRSRFAAYLRRRMIEYDEVDEDPRIERDEIPRILDPNTMCTSVESSFTTLISKAETADEGDAPQPATDALRRRSKHDYDDDSDSESSYCTDCSDDYSEEDDAKSLGYFMSFFNEADPDTAMESNNEAFETVAKWCEDIPLPSAPQLEDLLKIATDFGFSSKTKKVTEKPHSQDQEALSDFVEELENEEPLPVDNDRGAVPRVQQESTLPHVQQESTLPHVQQESTLPRVQQQESTLPHVQQQESTLAVPPKPKARQTRKPEPDLQTTLSTETQQDCGVLTLQDFHELALMAAEAIAARTKQMKPARPMTVRTKRKVLKTKTSTDSSEAAWECVEHTVNDLESVTGSKSPHQEKSSVQERIKAKLEHIKKTQPQVYKVFLAKMAAAEKSGRKFDFHRDDMIPKGSSALKEQTPESRSKAIKEPQSEDVRAQSEHVTVQTPRISVKIEVESSAAKSSPSWESFDDSPFKEPGIRPHLSAASTGSRDDSSVFDDFKWLSSAKDSFTSTVESFIDGPKKMARPLRTKLAQYSKTHPNLYRMLLEKVNEGDTLKHMDQHESEEGKAAGESAATKLAVLKQEKASSHSNARTLSRLANNQVEEEGSQVEVTEAEFEEQGASASVQRQVVVPGMVRPKQNAAAKVSPSPNVMEQKSFHEWPTQHAVAPTDCGLQPVSPSASLPAKASTEVRALPAPLQELKMKPIIEGAKASAAGMPSEGAEAPSHVRNNQKLDQARPSEPMKQGSILGERKLKLERKLFPDVASSQTKKPLLNTHNTAETNVPGEDPKRNFAKKVEFFAKGISPVHQKGSVVSEAKEKIGKSQVGSKVSMFSSAARERQGEVVVGSKGRVSPSIDTQRAATTSEQKATGPSREVSNPNVGLLAGVERSKTPLSSNRTGRGNASLPQQEAKNELSSDTATPVLSNRSDTIHSRPPAIRSSIISSKATRPPQTPKSKLVTFPPVAGSPEPKLEKTLKRGNDSQQVPDQATSSSSQWETFEGSSFKGFVFQSLTGTKTEQTDKGPGPKSIDLQATFLDSILPAPPSFPSHSEMHSQRDPWDFSEAAGEQWEHFSPLSFDSNFTNWGLKERPTSTTRKPAARRKTKASPSSVAEF